MRAMPGREAVWLLSPSLGGHAIRRAPVCPRTQPRDWQVLRHLSWVSSPVLGKSEWYSWGQWDRSPSIEVSLHEQAAAEQNSDTIGNDTGKN